MIFIIASHKDKVDRKHAQYVPHPIRMPLKKIANSSHKKIRRQCCSSNGGLV